MVGFAGMHWNAPADISVAMSIRFSNVLDARLFCIGLVILTLAFAVNSVVDLSRNRLSLIVRAAVGGANLLVVGTLLGISVSTSGWTASAFPKFYWTFAPIGLLLFFTYRVCFSNGIHLEGHSDADVVTHSGENAAS
jgi:hypothetical protein